MTTVELILFSILLVFGYFVVFQNVSQDIYNRRLIPILSVVVLFVYICAVLFVVLLYFYFGDDPLVLFGALLIFAMLILARLLIYCLRHRDTMNSTYVMLFLLYCALVFFATLASRHTGDAQIVKMRPFAFLTHAYETHSLMLINHFFLNVCMFCPLGFLIPLMNLERFQKISFVFLFGGVVSTAIETTQLILGLGECDIDDMIANTLGAIVGYGIWKLYMHIKKKDGKVV